ncbi:SpoVR family protein [Geotalea uraniireducens]|uniref:SpoVR family protein n=1 Tax=Geotalea uraniireducens TaxID=351604 RepID=A0ABM8ERF4_9BACT|nr:SpoVR family protein [Geotalea uraniireducens]BDV44808.1 SpoVR family protein [Geotalea uraniireducens]
MQLIDQHTKKIMEGCKERAREAGLRFQDETLEYIVTNRDMLELSPKVMIPTLYDYWVHDVEVMKGKGKYELYPHNPYETVINTRPPISFYNDNNPDWLNVMIFYHVLAHIDFFQNNLYYRHTWDYDLTGKALSDKRLIARLRSEHGRWVDYLIEFGRSIDNLVGYFDELSGLFREEIPPFTRRLDFYFDYFLQTIKKTKTADYVKEIERYNRSMREYGELGEETFFADTARKYPEFEAIYLKSTQGGKTRKQDLLQFIMENSEFLNQSENKWMKSVLELLRSTSIYFQPQIRTKIMNEGWASYWHEQLFLTDERIKGHEIDFARCHSGVTALSRVGLNPYAIGMRLFQYLEEIADQGRLSLDFQRLADIGLRERYDRQTGTGREMIFALRENYCDFSFISTFIDQDFVNRHKLFVAGRRFNKERMAWQYYVKSRKAEEYRAMLLNSLYHPPKIEIELHKGGGKYLYLIHQFEEKPLIREFIANTMMGIEFLWGGPVQLETSEVVSGPPAESYQTLAQQPKRGQGAKIHWRRFVYTMENRALTKTAL